MSLYLGIDQSLTEPGLVVIDEQGTLVVGAALKVADKCRGGARLAAAQRFYETHTDTRDVVRAAMEGPALGATHREFDLGEASGVARLYCFQVSSHEPLIVAPAQLKKFICGTTGATKEDVMHAVKKFYGFSTDNDNIADAYVLAQIARQLHLDSRPLTRAAAEVLAALRFSPPSTAPAKRPTSKTARSRATNL